MKVVNVATAGSSEARDSKVREWRKKYKKVSVQTKKQTRDKTHNAQYYVISAWE